MLCFVDSALYVEDELMDLHHIGCMSVCVCVCVWGGGGGGDGGEIKF